VLEGLWRAPLQALETDRRARPRLQACSTPTTALDCDRRSVFVLQSTGSTRASVALSAVGAWEAKCAINGVDETSRAKCHKWVEGVTSGINYCISWLSAISFASGPGAGDTRSGMRCFIHVCSRMSSKVQPSSDTQAICAMNIER